MVAEDRWGTLAAWVGRECAVGGHESGLMAVRRVEGRGQVLPLDPAEEGVLSGLVERWLGRQIEAVGSSLTLTFEVGSDGHETIVKAAGDDVFSDVGDGSVAVRFTSLVGPDGHNAVAVTSLDGQVSHGDWEEPESATKFASAPPLVELADDALTHLRAQFGLPTRPWTITPLWDLLCIWADHVAATWHDQVAQVGLHAAALAALDARPDVVRTVVVAKLTAQQEGRSPDDVPWPSQRWAAATPDEVAAQVASLDDKAFDATVDPWGTVQCLYESATGQAAPYDGPALLRLGLLPAPANSDPIAVLSSLEPFPDWLGESAVRVARQWL